MPVKKIWSPPDGYLVNGIMYPAMSAVTEDAMIKRIMQLEADNKRLEEALADTFGAAVAQADLVQENNDDT